MSVYVKGNAVANATSYELMEKTSGGVYNSLAEANEINFDVSAMNLAAGDHTLVVKAKADGYEDSDVSNEVVYTVAAAPADDLAGTWLMNDTITATKASFGGKNGKSGLGINAANLYQGYRLDYTAGSDTFQYIFVHTTVDNMLGCMKTAEDAGVGGLYMSDEWSKAGYNTITITTKLAEVEGGETLLAWFNANGVKQS